MSGLGWLIIAAWAILAGVIAFYVLYAVVHRIRR